MNPVLILTHNNIELTKRCVESVRAQDIPTAIFISDNASTDGTFEWASETLTPGVDKVWHFPVNHGVSFGWNSVLSSLFSLTYGADHCLVIGNDTVLPPWFYSELLSFDAPFVTGFAVESMDELKRPEEHRTEPHPDFSAFLIRRDCWEKVGQFDERMVSWASDCDYHVRAHQLGVPLVKANVPFYHVKSSTIRLAPTEEQAMFHAQANKDRAQFKEKWGCIPGDALYPTLFSPGTFGSRREPSCGTTDTATPS